MNRYMLDAASFVLDHTEATFGDDRKTFLAVLRCLEVISEASRRLPDDMKSRHPDIPWRQMAAAGNVYRHDYDGVTEPQVWQTVTLALPRLRAAIEQELATLPTPTKDAP